MLAIAGRVDEDLHRTSEGIGRIARRCARQAVGIREVSGERDRRRRSALRRLHGHGFEFAPAARAHRDRVAVLARDGGDRPSDATTPACDQRPAHGATVRGSAADRAPSRRWTTVTFSKQTRGHSRRLVTVANWSLRDGGTRP